MLNAVKIANDDQHKESYHQLQVVSASAETQTDHLSDRRPDLRTGIVQTSTFFTLYKLYVLLMRINWQRLLIICVDERTRQLD